MFLLRYCLVTQWCATDSTRQECDVALYLAILFASNVTGDGCRMWDISLRSWDMSHPRNYLSQRKKGSGAKIKSHKLCKRRLARSSC